MKRREFHKLMTGAALFSPALPALSRVLQSSIKPRFSVMLWTLEKQDDFVRCLGVVAAAGYQGVELVGEFQGWSAEQCRQNIARIRSFGLTVDAMSGVKTGFADPQHTADFLLQVEAHLHSATVLGCPQIILLSGPRLQAFTPQTQRDTAIENLKRAAELAARSHIEIVIEPIDPLENPQIFLQTVTDGFEIARAAGQPNLKVLYDFYHEQRAFGNLLEKLENNIDLVGLVHIADVPGRHQPGTGEINYTNIYRKLAALRYDRWIAMEFYPTGNPTTTLQLARQAAERAFL